MVENEAEHIKENIQIQYNIDQSREKKMNVRINYRQIISRTMNR